MKITKKILTSLASATLITTGAISISSCACTQEVKHIEGAETDVSIVGNGKYTYFEFTLNEAVKDGQELTCDAEGNDDFVFGDLTIENKLVSLPVVWTNENVFVTKSITKDIKFTLKNKSDSSTVWQETIKGCKASYAPNIVLTSDVISTTEILEENNTRMQTTITFQLGEELDSILELKPYFLDYNSEDGYSVNKDKTKIEVDGKDVTLTLVVDRDKEIGAGDAFKFDLQIECVVVGTIWTYWQSNVFSSMSVSYSAVEKDILVDDLLLESSSTTDPTEFRLVGIKKDSAAWTDKSYNTLVIPTKTTERWIRYVGTTNGDTITLPEGINKIKIAGIGVQRFEKNCFYGLEQIRYLDLSAITDSVQSLDTVLTFGENSYGNWNDEGHIIWHSQLSQYKRHIVKEKLYKAGLTSPSWYGIISVTNISQLKEAAYVGGTIQLEKDITITPDEDYNGQINFYVSSILDLNGHTISVKDRPIFNSKTKEFAVIGVWDCELLVTDSSENHDGCIKAFDNSAIHNKDSKPTKEGKEFENNQWEWETNRGSGLPNRWRTRENRTFYVRSDIPTRAKGTLEIMAGNFYGNCTTIMNWNTTVYIEDGYSTRPDKKEDYKGEYAPQFHLYSKNCGLNTYTQYDDPTAELLNCEDTTSITGQAKFELWGGKFMAYDNIPTSTKTEQKLCFYNPETSKADKTPTPSGESQRYGHWNYIYDDDGYITSEKASDVITDSINKWTLLVPNEW